MSAVGLFLKEFSARLERIEDTRRVLNEALRIIGHLEDLCKQVRGLSVVARLRKVLPVSVDELLDPEKAKELRSYLEEVYREALLEAISRVIGIDVRFHTRVNELDKLYELFRKIADLIDNVRNKDEIKTLIIDNISKYDEKIEDLMQRYSKILLEFDKALDEAEHIRIKFYKGDLRDLILSCAKEKHITELRQLPKLLGLLRRLSKLESSPEIECKKYSTPLVRGWCNRYNEQLRKLLEMLEEIADTLQRLNLTNIDNLEDLCKKAEKAREEVEKYCRNIISRVFRIIGRPPAEIKSFKELLEFADKGVAELRLTPVQQHILVLLSEKQMTNLEELINELKSNGIDEVEALCSLYNLCSKGIVRCTAEL